MTKISEIVDFNPKRTIKKGSIGPFVDMAALPVGSRDISEISEREFKSGGSKFQDGDILFARITPCLENGKTVKVSGLGTNVFAHGSTEFIVMAAKEPYYDEYYVYYLARLSEFRDYAQARMEGTSGRQRVSWQSLSEFEFEFPEKEERKTIGITLKAFDDKIALNRQINQTLESMAQAIFKSWFVNFDPVKAKIAALESGEDAEGVIRAAMRAISGKTDDELDKIEGEQPENYAQLKTTAELFPAAMQNSELGEVPEGWDILDFDKFVSRSNEKVGIKEVPEYSSTNDGLKLRSETFNKQLSKNRSNNKLIRNNDLVFGLSRQILNFGLMRDEIGAVSPVYNVFSINTKMIVSDFVEKYIRERMKFYYGMINGSAREGQSISVKQFLKMPFLIPPLKVQEELDSYLQLISTKINQIQCEINILSELRDILLPKFFSGELSVDALKITNEQGD